MCPRKASLWDTVKHRNEGLGRSDWCSCHDLGHVIFPSCASVSAFINLDNDTLQTALISADEKLCLRDSYCYYLYRCFICEKYFPPQLPRAYSFKQEAENFILFLEKQRHTNQVQFLWSQWKFVAKLRIQFASQCFKHRLFQVFSLDIKDLVQVFMRVDFCQYPWLEFFPSSQVMQKTVGW